MTVERKADAPRDAAFTRSWRIGVPGCRAPLTLGRRARTQFFGEAGTGVGCGVDDAHREWHRNRLLLLQAYQTTLLQRPARTLTQVKAGDAPTTVLNEPPRRTPTLVHRTSNGCTAADPLTGGGRRRSGKKGVRGGSRSAIAGPPCARGGLPHELPVRASRRPVARRPEFLHGSGDGRIIDQGFQSRIRRRLWSRRTNS